jgi:DNA end-binding protein Ku
MARSLWNGTVSFGLVNVPVKLYSATESKTVHFHEVHAEDGARVEHRRFCAKEDREVPYEEVVKGYEVADGEYVVLDKDEIAAASGERTHVIDVEAFVELGEIDPVFYDKAYFLGAGDKGEDAYRLLHDALERTGRAALGRFTFHNREYLAAIRPLDDVLALHTMRFADELVAGDDVDVEPPEQAPSGREVEMADRLLESLHEDFRPERYHDEYREAVLEVIRRKAAGKEIAPPEEPEPESAPDLFAALEASLGDGKGSGGKRSGGRSRRKAKA